MENVFEVIRNVFLGSSHAIENGDLLREHSITYLLGICDNYSLSERRTRHSGLILGSKTVHIKDTVLEVVEECNDYIHFCRKSGCNLLVHSPRFLSLSSLMIALYMRTVSDCRMQDVIQLLRHFRPDHDFELYRREWAHFGSSNRGLCVREKLRLGLAWAERQPALTNFDYAILTQLQMESVRMLNRRRNCPVQTFDGHQDLLTCKSLEEYRRNLLVDKAAKEEALRREMKEKRREQKYQIMYMPDYKLTYDCHEFDESVFHNARLVDFYLPSSIESMLKSQEL